MSRGDVEEPEGNDRWHEWNQGILEANRAVIVEFRANAGRVGGYFAGAPMLLLHHVGARTGREHVNPLVYLADGGDLLVAASKGGAPTDPDWYRNLRARPRAGVEVGEERFPVDAADVVGAERDRLYRRLAELRPAFADYQLRTDRVIPLVRLTRVGDRPRD